MPTIPEMKAELKALGVKGITGKNKAELMAMLEQAKAPKVAPKAIPLKDILKKRKPEIGDLSEPPKEEPKKKPEIGNDGLAELLGIIATSIAGPAPAPAPAPHETEEGEALQSFGHFIWRRFDTDETKRMKKNYRRTAGGMFPLYAMDLVKVEENYSTYWEKWNPIIGLTIPGVSGKALATCNPDGTVSFTNIMLEEGEEASYSVINDAIVKEYREYGAGDLQPRYKNIAKALTTMKIINKGKKSQGEKKPSKEEIEDFVRSEIVRLDLPKKEAERPSQMGIKKASPPPRIPKSIKDTMTGKLAQEYDLHEYKIGLAHPIDDMIKWFKKVMNQDIWGKYISVATGFLTDLTKWVRENSHERPSWGDKDKTERVLLLSDWEDFFKANR